MVFKPGISGNPAGRVSVAAVHAALAAEFGDLSPSEEVLVRTAAKLLARAQHASSNRSVRCATEARALLRQVRTARAAAKAAKRRSTSLPSLDLYLTSLSEKDRTSGLATAGAGRSK
jgi:hypothetical protein